MQIIRNSKSKTVLAVATMATTLCTMGGIFASSAHADYAPTGADVVGVGSDTVQYLANFAADGDPLGDSGYNTAGLTNKIVSFDATADSNARFAYANNSTNASLKVLNPTVVLRAGSSPVQRPNGSGAGYAAILADTSTVHAINFVRGSRPPKLAEQNTAAAEFGTGGLHVIQISTDPLQLAAATVTNAPAAISVTDTAKIYSGTFTTWTQIPGGTSASTIIPVIPQSGSGTRSSFLADLQAANNNVAITLGPNVIVGEENDPTAITGAARPVDAIEPFSASRLNLYNSGYFLNPNTPYSTGNPPAALSAGIQMLTGAGTYSDIRGLYLSFRNSDLTQSPWQSGGHTNWAQVLFSKGGNNALPAPFFASGGAGADIAAAGGTFAYSDLGQYSVG